MSSSRRPTADRVVNKLSIMVLCSFVYLMLRHDIPPLLLQPTEVHSTHWVPIRRLLSPALRTYERCDVSDRLQQQRGPIVKSLICAATGDFVFGATQLMPSESLFCSSSRDFIPKSVTDRNAISYAARILNLRKRPNGGQRPLILWGLTLGVVCDLLEQVDAQGTQMLWSWPTFSHWDIRAIVHIITVKIRARKLRGVNPMIEGLQQENIGPKIDGLDHTTFATSPQHGASGPQSGIASADILDAYFGLMRRGVVIALVFRATAVALFVALLTFRYRDCEA